MTSTTRNISLLVARSGLAALLLSFTVFSVWTADHLLGQQPEQKKQRVEEEEDTPKAKPPAGKKKRVEEEEEAAPRKKAKPKVIRVDEDEEPQTKAAPSRPSGPAGGSNLTQLAEEAKHPAIQAFFRSLAIPYDLVLYKRTSVTINGERRQREEKIQPAPIFIGDDPGRFRNERFRFTPYTVDWKPDTPISVDPGLQLEYVRPYEKIAQEKVRDFLKDSTPAESSDSSTPLTDYQKLVAAEQALTAVLSWHQSARLTDQRKGKEWESIEAALRKQLLDEVLLKQMEVLTQAKDWEGVLELAHRLAGTYTKESERRAIFQPVANMIQRALNDPTSSEQKRQLALKRLQDLARDFPDSTAFKPLANALERLAKFQLDEAKRSIDDKQMDRAREYLQRAQELWPQVEGARELRKVLDLEHPTLRVGVRGLLPKYFSPAWACTENERRAMEMMFESLVKLIPDEAGGYRYVQGLSESYPRVVPMGRQFDLPRNAFWSDSDGRMKDAQVVTRRSLNSSDIRASLSMLQAGKGVGRSRVWSDLLAEVESKKNPFQVTLQLRQGFIDPLALMTFKIVPVDHLVTTEKFALDPVTSGPFRLDRSRQSDEQKRECMFFLANPDYRLRPSKRGEPHIQEIRFYIYKEKDAVDELTKGKLDLLLDLTAKAAQELAKKQTQGQPIKVPLPSRTVPNRRIYFLAVNTHNLAAKDLRQAISFAIDRETLLNKHFRTSKEDPLHKVLNGPFPVGSWACKQDKNNPNKAGENLFNADEAKLSKQKPEVLEALKEGPWKLKYPNGDAALAGAIKDICDQVKELTGVVLEPELRSPYDLRKDVEITQNYDVAYYHYDFPDECYWLAPLFSLPPGADDDRGNMFRYQNKDLTILLDGMKSFRNFAKVQEYQWATHALINSELPFIPLWQLDPLLAYRDEVRPVALDPLLPFSNIEQWHLLRK